MDEEKNSPADGPGEALIDEPTEPALDPVADPNTEWEEKAADQISEGEGGASGNEASEDPSSAEASTEGGPEESGS